MNLSAWMGLVVMIVSEAATLGRIEPFWSWNTPIAWTGFILFADGIVWRARGNSWLRSSPGEFALLALVSIPLWLVFEGYNRFIQNWYYVGLPENWWLRQFGYAWSYATIWPAIFEGAELVAVLRSGGSGRSGRFLPDPPDLPVPPGPLRPVQLSVAAGALMLALPFLVPPAAAQYLAAPVWLGFIFLLDPVNRHLGAESLAVDLGSHRYDRLINLTASGCLCGILWEFWNYWARAKWHYTVPIMERLKVFEMPLPGYFGFPAFAFECFAMYVFVRRVVASGSGRGTNLGRTIAL